jgi:TatD DNase family protein
MIDTHCHLGQEDYDKDRHKKIEKWKEEIEAVITSCAHPKDYDLTIKLVNNYKDFVFASASIHPSYIQELGEKQIEDYIEKIESAKNNFVAVGETGLDYKWVKEHVWQIKQKELFIKFIVLSQKLELPLVIHSRDATQEVVEILFRYKAKRVQMHMFSARPLLKDVIENGWFISVNTLLLRSKNVKKIVRDCPLDRLMLETDSPWLGLDKNGRIRPKDVIRNEPTAIKLVAKRIAKIKRVSFDEVDEKTTENAKDFFELNI